MVYTKITSAALILSAALLGACAERVQTYGHVIKETQVNKVQMGEHTRRDVAQILGTPTTLSTYDAKKWYYVSERVTHRVLSPNNLKKRDIVVVEFDDNGKVSAIAYKDQSAAKEIEPATNRTRTHGQQLGIVDQMIDNVKRGLPGGN